MNRGASIITNFGCDTGCKYCIWNNHPLKECHTSLLSTDWDKLTAFITPYEKISISGGGDPFYDYNTHKPWFDKLCSVYSGKIDVHTSKILPNTELTRFNKIVLHENYESFKMHLPEIRSIKNPLRLVFVVTNQLTIEKIDDIISKRRELSCQLSFRELYESDNNLINIYRYIDSIAKIENIMFIKQRDYNIYFMPDNSIRNTFMGE